MQLYVQRGVRRPHSYSLVLKYGAPLDYIFQYWHASSAAAVCGRGQFEVLAHVEVEAIVTDSKAEKDILLSSAEVGVVVILCSRFVG